MSTLHTIAAALGGCNLHFCLYGGFGAALLVRAILALRERRYEEAREQSVLGILHLALAMA